MLIWYFSNNLNIYNYIGKLPEQHFSVWYFSNPGDEILLLLKFNEARISEWNVSNFKKSKEGIEVIRSDWRVNYHHLFWCGISKLLYYAGLQRLYLINIQLIYFSIPHDYWSGAHSLNLREANYEKKFLPWLA